MKVTLFLWLKQLNPFIEEVEEGFKIDVLILMNCFQWLMMVILMTLIIHLFFPFFGNILVSFYII